MFSSPSAEVPQEEPGMFGGMFSSPSAAATATATSEADLVLALENGAADVEMNGGPITTTKSASSRIGQFTLTEKIDLTWDNVRYTVPIGKGKKSTKVILDGLQGVASSGTMTGEGLRVSHRLCLDRREASRQRPPN